MSRKEQKIFVVYFHINSFTEEVFYVGIGNEARPYNKEGRSPFWKNYVKKYGYKVKLVHAGLNWHEACAYEKLYIKQFGRRNTGLGQLLNMTDGGDGATGQVGPWKGKKRPELGELNKKRIPKSKGKTGLYKHSAEIKKKLSELHKGKTPWNKGKKGVQKMSESARAKRRAYLLGRKHSAETRLKMSKSSKGRKKTPEHVEKMRLVFTGKKHSNETKNKMAKIIRERWSDPKFKEKMSNILRERWKDMEYRNKVLESRKKTCRTRNAA